MAPLSRSGVLAVLCLSVLVWSLSHGYQGIVHDARLYTLQALAYLHPESLSGDVFLRYGSQDHFTVFSPLYAATAQIVGIEPAAALLTLLSQIGLCAALWYLARTVLPSSAALLGVAVALALPGDYGADRIFTCVEPFLTPRMGAEALTLCALGAALRGRTLIAAVCCIAAALLHPIMAAAGVTALALYYGALPRPRTAAAVALLGAVGLMATLALLPADGDIRFDPVWLHLVEARSPYLFVTEWHGDDWSRAAVPLAGLSLAARSLDGRARALSGLALLTALAGFALSLLLCDGLHWVLATQLQPWRWQWLATAVAMVLLLPTLDACRRRGPAGAITALLLAAAWIFCGSAYALVPAVAAVASPAAAGLKAGEQRLLMWGSWGLLAVAMIWRVASILEFTDVHYLELSIPNWARHAMSLSADGSIPVAVIAATAWASGTRRGRFVAAGVALLAVTGVVALLPLTLQQWTVAEAPPQHAADYAVWRARIPVGAEVFWPEAPVQSWLLLQRPSYLSIVQTSGIVFSRGAALEMQRRALALEGIVAPEAFLGWSTTGGSLNLSKDQLRRACDAGAFQYLVTRADLGPAPVAMIAEKGVMFASSRRLYRCPLATPGS
jgi:hypothetical protein